MRFNTIFWSFGSGLFFWATLYFIAYLLASDLTITKLSIKLSTSQESTKHAKFINL